MVAELNFRSKAYYTSYFTGKISQYRLIRKNHETFPPQMIFNIWYMQMQLKYTSHY